MQTNIISDGGPGSVAALVTDSTFINPWGVSVGPAIWIDKAGSGSVAVDTAAGKIVIPLVTIPAASASAQGTPSEGHTTTRLPASICQVALPLYFFLAPSTVRLPPGIQRAARKRSQDVNPTYSFQLSRYVRLLKIIPGAGNKSAVCQFTSSAGLVRCF